VSVSVGSLYHVTEHTYPNGLQVRLFFYDCGIVTGAPQLLWGQAFRWVAPTDLPGFATPAADRDVLARLSVERSDAIPEAW
jgi:hypothetical protein